LHFFRIDSAILKRGVAMDKDITIEEIAKLAGVSIATVSLVINDRGSQYRISKKTQQKILDIVDEKKYLPNQLARGFRLKKTHTIGLVVPDLTNLFFSLISHEIEVMARKNNYQVLITCSDDSEETEYNVINNLHARRVDGLIIASVLKREQIAKDISRLGIPVVYIDRRIEGDNVSWVASDNYQGAFDLVNHMCQKGINEICYIGGLKGISTSRNRLKGYREALKANGIPYRSELVFQKDYTIASGFAMAKEMYTRLDGPPKSFFTASLTLLEGALNYTNEKEGRIPDDMLIGTYDDHPFLDYMSVKISSVRQDTRRIAHVAIDMILDAISGKQSVQQKIIKPLMIHRN
jgi:D-fructose-responsive transcription factor